MAKSAHRGSGRGSCNRSYHQFISVVTLLAGAGLLGVGVWRRMSNDQGPFDLKYTDVQDLENIWSLVRSWTTAAIVLGAALLASGLIGFIAVSRNCLGGLAKVLFFLIALVLTAALAGTSSVSFYLLSQTNDAGKLENFIETTWEQTVADNKNAICVIEADRQCRGVKNGECSGCRLGVESTCSVVQKTRCAPCSTPANIDVNSGCYDSFSTSFRRYYIAVGAVTAVLAGLMFIDLCVICGL
jgi:hypothetical protein